MKRRKSISIIMAGLLMSFVSFNPIHVSAAEETAAVEKPALTAKADDNGNFVHLDWTFKDANKNKDYSYKLFSKEENEPIYQSIPAKSNVKVLNIYPNAGNNLKTWMEDNGFGKGLITVDPVNIVDVNKKTYDQLKAELTDDNGNWKYDVIMLGSADANNSLYPSEDAVKVFLEFINSGRGFLAGHDNIGYEWGTKYGLSKIRDKFNIKVGYWTNKNAGQDEGFEKYFGGISGDKVSLKKKGLLTNYPWNLEKDGPDFKVPTSHSTSNFAYGDIWMTYTDNTHWNGTTFPESMDKYANFYLTTWNNTAMIQTGHSGSNATPDEQKILANTLFYLAQVTEEVNWNDHKGQDVAAPTKPEIKSVKYDKTNKKVNVEFKGSEDNGSTYDYYVEATEKGTGKILPISDTAKATIKTGLKGYSIVVDQNPDTVPDGKNTITDTACTLDGDYNNDFYVHVVAVDNAGNVEDKDSLGNISAVDTYHYSFPTLNLSASEVDENNNVTITAKAENGEGGILEMNLPDGTTVGDSTHDFKVSANGTYTFTVWDHDGNNVSESIKVNTIPANVELNLDDSGDHAVLNWSVDDTTQDYTYTVYSRRSDVTGYTPIPVEGTSYNAEEDKDVAAPAKPDITDVNIDKENNTTSIKFTKSHDNSTSYLYFVEAVSSETGKSSTSQAKYFRVSSELKGYSIVVDEKTDTVPDGKITTTDTEYTFDKAYEGHFYVHVAAVDNAGNISEVDTYECNKPVLELTTNTDKIVKDKVTITADASKSLRKVVKIITPDNKEVVGDKAEYPVDVNGEYSFTAIDENGNKTTKIIKVENVIPDVILNVEPTTINKHLNEKFTADLTINNIKDVYATQIRVKYDSSNLEFLGFDQVDGVRLTYDNRADGELTFILLSKNINYPMSGKSTIIKMNFKGIQPGQALIDVVKGSVSDGLLFEKDLRDAECGHAVVNICDRELKKEYTLFDVAEIVRHYGENPEELLKQGIDVDLNLDGIIDEADSAMCQEFMLNNPNRKF